MKKIFALGLGLISSFAFAQNVMELNRFFKKGEFEFNSKFAHERYDFHDENSGPRTYVRSGTLANKLSYGITNNLRVGLAHEIATERTFKTSGIKNTELGPNDLKALVEYRAFTDSKTFIDFFGGFQLSTEKKENAHHSNFREGHSVLNLGAAWGQMLGKHEWRMSGDLLYHFYGKEVGQNKNPYTTFFLDTKYQYRPQEKLALGLGMDWEYLGEITTKTPAGRHVQDTDSILAFSAFLKYEVYKNIALEGGYRIQMRYELDSEYLGMTSTDKYREGSTCYLGTTIKF